jgi:hypothetical protein
VCPPPPPPTFVVSGVGKVSSFSFFVKMPIVREVVGRTGDVDIVSFTLTNKSQSATAKLLNYGATLTHLLVRDVQGVRARRLASISHKEANAQTTMHDDY